MGFSFNYCSEIQYSLLFMILLCHKDLLLKNFVLHFLESCICSSPYLIFFFTSDSYGSPPSIKWDKLQILLPLCLFFKCESNIFHDWWSPFDESNNFKLSSFFTTFDYLIWSQSCFLILKSSLAYFILFKTSMACC